jgi:hypothetical protein
MKHDPGMHIGLHLVFFGKTGVTVGESSVGVLESFRCVENQQPLKEELMGINTQFSQN